MMMWNEIVLSVIGAIITIIVSVVSVKVNKYITRREKEEKVKEAHLELYFIKLDAVIYAMANVGVHRKEFDEMYKKRYKEIISERSDIEQIVKQQP